MEFKEARIKQLGIKSLGEMIRSGKVSMFKDPSSFVYGPESMDCLNDKWSKKEVLGLIGGSGAGKTQIVMDIFRNILQNSKDPNSIVIFVSLEMTVNRIAERWQNLVGPDSPLTDRLYVVSNFDDNDKARCLTTAGILNECLRIKHILGVEIESVCIDHLHIITPSSKETLNDICQRIKDLAVETNSFTILLSQTTKGKGGALCDKPLDKDASFGCSQFAWIASYVITIHQPLASVQSETDLRCLSWGYAKVREKHKNDKIQTGQFQLLHYDIETGQLRKMTKDELFIFSNYYQLVLERRAEEQEDDVERVNYNMKIEVNA